MVANEKWFTGSGATAGVHNIEQSCSFDEDAGDKLTRSPSSGGNRRTFTISFWLKRTTISHSGNHMVIFGADPQDGGSNFFHLRLGNDDTFRIVSSGSFQWIFTPLFKDNTGWGHFFVAIDTTQGSQADQVKFYHNGSLITDTSLKSGPSSNFQTQVNHTVQHQIGVLGYGGNSTDFAGYLAEFFLIDGTAHAPTDFGESFNGYWRPKSPSGLNFGTNGVHLKFEASGIGTDSSSNSNNYTATNLDATNITIDTPTNGAGS
tara:strand:+ start:661 stop:1443 length:783 start_codon:yes stop_codon:yes gene_type:complete